MRMDISAVIITKDDAERVSRLAEYLLGVLDDVLVLIDDRSGTEVEEALSQVSGCRYEMYTFNGFGEAKRKAVSLAKYDWIFSIDADEWPDADCVNSLEQLDLSIPAIYKFKRLNHYCGRPIKACGWYPDFVIRVFHRDVANFSEHIVHESVKPHEAGSAIGELSGHILHYSFNGSHELLQKLIQYSSLYAENYTGKAKPVPLILLRAIFAFVKFYIFKKGVIYGRDGFIISLMNAGGVFHKHWRAGELASKRS